METSHLPGFVKYQRKQLGITQEELALQSGVGLRFVRELEQGKTTLRLDKVNQLLAFFGFQLRADSKPVDPYWLWQMVNKGVIITLKNKQELYGILLNEVLDDTNQIVAWRFLPNSRAIEYKRKPNAALVQTIQHNDIESVTLQKY